MTLDLTILTLAEALVERKALKLHLDNLGARLVSNARVQEWEVEMWSWCWLKTAPHRRVCQLPPVRSRAF